MTVPANYGTDYSVSASVTVTNVSVSVTIVCFIISWLKHLPSYIKKCFTYMNSLSNPSSLP